VKPIRHRTHGDLGVAALKSVELHPARSWSAILIAQHIKGPVDKPLRPRDAVKVWDQE
jgi:hypothetical protein